MVTKYCVVWTSIMLTSVYNPCFKDCVNITGASINHNTVKRAASLIAWLRLFHFGLVTKTTEDGKCCSLFSDELGQTLTPRRAMLTETLYVCKLD